MNTVNTSQEENSQREKIDFWEWCRGYCSAWIPNKVCGRLDTPCRNLKSCDTRKKDEYEVLKKQFLIKEIGKDIESCLDDISHIY